MHSYKKLYAKHIQRFRSNYADWKANYGVHIKDIENSAGRKVALTSLCQSEEHSARYRDGVCRLWRDRDVPRSFWKELGGCMADDAKAMAYDRNVYNVSCLESIGVNETAAKGEVKCFE